MGQPLRASWSGSSAFAISAFRSVSDDSLSGSPLATWCGVSSAPTGMTGQGAGQVAGMESIELAIHTGSRVVTDLTAEVARFCDGRGDGLVNVFAPHATAGLALIETGAGSDEDLIAILGDLLPRDHRYRHRHGSPGHGADHVLPALIAPSIAVPVLDGRLVLGTWQSIVLVDTNADNADRTVRLSFLAG